MDYKEYSEKRYVLEKQLRDLRHEFIQSNITIPAKSKVMITFADGKSRPYYIMSYIVRGNGVIPILKRVKNDGTVAKNLIHNMEYDKIVKMEKL